MNDSNRKKRNRKRKTTAIFVVVLAVFAFTFIRGWGTGKAITEASYLGDCLGLDEDDGWTVLARPNSVWKPGIAVEFSAPGKGPTFIGDFLAECLPGTHVQEWIGVSAPVSCARTLDYSLSLLATFGLPDETLAELGLEAGGSEGPNLVTRVKIDAARETFLDVLKIENYLTPERFDEMLVGCKRSLTDGQRFVVAGTYQIEVGTLSVERQDGSKVNLGAPELTALKDAIVKNGFNVNSSGQIMISKDTPPLTVAVRSADFSKILSSLGIGRRGGSSFGDLMRKAGEAFTQ